MALVLQLTESPTPRVGSERQWQSRGVRNFLSSITGYRVTLSILKRLATPFQWGNGVVPPGGPRLASFGQRDS